VTRDGGVEDAGTSAGDEQGRELDGEDHEALHQELEGRHEDRQGRREARGSAN
jgi:hypothetical protein